MSLLIDQSPGGRLSTTAASKKPSKPAGAHHRPRADLNVTRMRSAFRFEAEEDGQAKPADSVENDPQQTCGDPPMVIESTALGIGVRLDVR
jgi:hypothetical protein